MAVQSPPATPAVGAASDATSVAALADEALAEVNEANQTLSTVAENTAVAATPAATPAPTQAATAVVAATPAATQVENTAAAATPAEDLRELTPAVDVPPTFSPAHVMIGEPVPTPGDSQTSQMAYESAEQSEPGQNPDGEWSWNDPNPDGQTDATISGSELKDVNGYNTTLTSVTPFNFHVKAGYHGGSATYTPDAITWVDGTIWTRVNKNLI